MEVSLTEMLEAREKRAWRQRELLKCGRTVICFTMNIAGPIKNSPLISSGYDLGKRLLLGQLDVAGVAVSDFEEVREKTGNECILLVDAEPLAVKAITAELEPTCVYPLIQGSDLSQWSVRSRAWLLCPHTAETKIYPLAEADLRQDLPLTYAYLTRFRDLLETRKGFAGWERAIQERYFYALLRVGPYTFSRYKVAWRYIARSFITAVIAPMQDPYLGETLPLPNEKVVYVGTDCREEAYYLCGILSSAPVRCCVTCYMNPTSISAHVLDKLHIPAFDPADSRHLSIAALCEEGHRASDPRCQDAVRQQLDRAVAALYGLTSADLDTVRSMLEKI